MNVKEVSCVVQTQYAQTTNRAMTVSAKSDTSQKLTQLDAKVNTPGSEIDCIITLMLVGPIFWTWSSIIQLSWISY